MSAADTPRDVPIWVAAASATVVFVSAERMMNPPCVVCTCASLRFAPAAAVRTSAIVLFETFDSVTTVPPLKSMPRFRPRTANETIATVSTIPDARNIQRRLPMKSM